ncbi:probable galacturonosyltransferase 7 isoform X2 [Tanacetum coccineum]
MSDNIPFEIQMEIIKKVSSVKSLIQFRSVSKPWKSFIDSSQFIKGYGSRHTQPRSRIVSYKSGYIMDELRYICLVDDDIKTFKVQQQEFAPFVVSPLLEQYLVKKVVGACHGLLCFYGYHRGYNKWMVVIWNPSIGKSFGIVVPSYDPQTYNYGFGVCPVASDPTVVKFVRAVNMPWHVEVFTLSSGVWNVIPSGNLPRKSIKLNELSTQVVIDRFIYWGACEKISTDDGESNTNHMVVSFDLITKEFKVVDLPHTLTNKLLMSMYVSVSKLRGSLVVSGYTVGEGGVRCSVWVMEHDSSFRKLFSTGTTSYIILGFRNNDETIFETVKEDVSFATLDVYDPCSQQINNFGIFGLRGSFFMGSYKESLLLIDHLDSRIYYDNN